MYFLPIFIFFLKVANKFFENGSKYCGVIKSQIDVRFLTSCFFGKKFMHFGKKLRTKYNLNRMPITGNSNFFTKLDESTIETITKNGSKNQVMLKKNFVFFKHISFIIIYSLLIECIHQS